MTKSSIIKVYRATRCPPVLILQLCLMVWTYDLIGSAESTLITHPICKNAVNSSVGNICCQEIILERDEHLKTCNSFLKEPNEPNTDKVLSGIIKLSKFTECVYEKRNYMKSSIKLNTAKVKAEANRLYPNDSLTQNFMVHKYRHCCRFASKHLKEAKEDPKQSKMLSRIHKPYFMFHYICTAEYSQKDKCPYFIWRAKEEDDNKKCTNFAAKCVKNRVVRPSAN